MLQILWGKHVGLGEGPMELIRIRIPTPQRPQRVLCVVVWCVWYGVCVVCSVCAIFGQ